MQLQKSKIIGLFKSTKHGQRGAAALEYILVSTFAAVIAVAALGFIGKVVKDELSTMATKLGVNETPELASPLGLATP